MCIYLFSGVTDVQECGDPGAFDFDIDLNVRPELGRLAYNDYMINDVYNDSI